MKTTITIIFILYAAASNAQAKIEVSCEDKGSCNELAELDNGSILIFPNPSNGIINVEAMGINIESYGIYDVLGTKLSEGKLTSNVIQFPEGERTGIYFIHFKTNDGILIKRILRR